MLSLDDLDPERLSARARRALSAVQRIENGGETEADVLAELGISPADYARDVQQLAHEWAEQGGPTKLPPLTSEEYTSLRDSISAIGQRYPILRGPDGKIWDGLNRLRACRELGKEPWFLDVDGTAEELESLALVVNLARRQLTPGARRGVIKQELLRDPERSDRAIATRVGVNHRTVADVRRELVAGGQVENFSTRVGRDGTRQPAAKPPRDPIVSSDELPDGVVDVTLRIAKEIAAEIDGGSWLDCKAIRLALIAPGVYSLEVRT